VASTSGSAHKTNDIATSAVFVDGSTTVLQVVISVAQMTTLKGTDSCTLVCISQLYYMHKGEIHRTAAYVFLVGFLVY
jgi:hypothetical protein